MRIYQSGNQGSRFILTVLSERDRPGSLTVTEPSAVEPLDGSSGTNRLDNFRFWRTMKSC
jgi:hypothetical protein